MVNAGKMIIDGEQGDNSEPFVIDCPSLNDLYGRGTSYAAATAEFDDAHGSK